MSEKGFREVNGDRCYSVQYVNGNSACIIDVSKLGNKGIFVSGETLDVWHITRLYVAKKVRGIGIATHLMNCVCMEADKVGTTLELGISSYGDGGKSNEELVEFYNKFGFILISEQVMVRYSRKVPYVRFSAQEIDRLAEFVTGVMNKEEVEVDIERNSEGKCEFIYMKNKNRIKEEVITDDSYNMKVYSDGTITWETRIRDRVYKHEYWIFGTKERLERYWHERMSERQRQDREIEILTNVLQGRCYEISCNKGEIVTLDDAYYDKRPYGNKNIEKSICFNLGWDRDSMVEKTGKLPDFVIAEAYKLHSAVLNNTI